MNVAGKISFVLIHNMYIVSNIQYTKYIKCVMLFVFYNRTLTFVV